MVDLDKALLDPSSVFKTPNDILNCNDISHDDKIRILRQWEYDCKELEIADDENMADNKLHPDVLDEVLQAIQKLTNKS